MSYALNILLCANEPYIKYASVAMYSLISHTQAALNFYILCDESAHPSTLQRLKSLQSARVRIHTFCCSLAPFRQLSTLNGSLMTYMRLLADSVLPSNIQRYLYIDTDVLVCGDILELYHINMEGKLLAAVRDVAFHTGSSHIPNHNDFYFNCGVLLVDLAKWRKERTTQRLFDILHTNPSLTEGFHDQNLLNFALASDTLELSMQWNVIYVPHLAFASHTFASSAFAFAVPQSLKADEILSRHSEQAYTNALQHPKILHFAAQPKPWEKMCYIKDNAPTLDSINQLDFANKPDSIHKARFSLIDFENPYARKWRATAYKSPFGKDIKREYIKALLKAYKTRLIYVAKVYCAPLYNILLAIKNRFLQNLALSPQKLKSSKPRDKGA